MNYDFPQIKTIDDVLPHISGREEFLVMEKEGYTVIKYAVAFEDTFQWDSNDPVGSAIRRECRGITFDTEGNLICRKYHKFFNVGEKEETQLNKINLYEPHIVLEKLDGSCVIPQPSLDGFVLTTKSGVTDISQQAEEFISDKPHYAKFIHSMFDGKLTPIFEWVSRKNRIVVDYENDNLILTAIRNTEMGNYLPHFNMLDLAEHWNIPVVQAVDGLAVQNIELFVKQIREWENGEEGVVVRFDSGHMVKVKSADYVLRHKTKDAINQEKNVLQTILNDSVDDLVPLLTPEDADRLKRFQKAFLAGLDEVALEMAELFVKGNKMYPEKKDFAVEFVQKKVEPIYAPIMYAMKAGRGSKEVLIEMIGKSLGSQTKIDAARWLWGNLDWNHIDKEEP
jgi:RNA ligase